MKPVQSMRKSRNKCKAREKYETTAREKRETSAKRWKDTRQVQSSETNTKSVQNAGKKHVTESERWKTATKPLQSNVKRVTGGTREISFFLNFMTL